MAQFQENPISPPLATALWVAGGAAVVGGLVWWFSRSKATVVPASTPQPTPVSTGGGRGGGTPAPGPNVTPGGGEAGTKTAPVGGACPEGYALNMLDECMPVSDLITL